MTSSARRVRAQTVKYWQWFWTSDVVKTIAVNLGFAVLPQVVRNIVLGQLLTDIKCNGNTVYVAPVTPTVYGVGTSMISSTMSKFVPAYSAQTSAAMMAYSVDTSTAVSSVLSASLVFGHTLATTQAFAMVASSELTAAQASANVVLPFAGLAIAAFFSPCGASNIASCAYSGVTLKLTPKLLADVLDGTITTWGDANLATYNSWLSGSALATANTAIQLVGEIDTSETMTTLLSMLAPYKAGLSFSSTFGSGGTAAIETDMERVSCRQL